MTWIAFLLGSIVGLALGISLKITYDRRTTALAHPQGDASDELPESEPTDLYDLAERMDRFFRSVAHPKDLLGSPEFMRGVEILAQADYSDDELTEYYSGDNVIISCMAFEALCRRPENDKVAEQLIAKLGETYVWPMYFAFRALRNKTKKPVVGAVILQAQEWWARDKLLNHMIDAFIRDRIEQGEHVTFGNLLTGITRSTFQHVHEFLRILDPSQVRILLDELKQTESTFLDSGYLNSVGRIWNGEQVSEFIWEHDRLVDSLSLIEKALFEEPSRSVLVVGETGVGKTILIQLLSRRLRKLGWRVFEASATDVLAGQVYIGELERRLQNLVENLNRRRSVLWFVPQFHELQYAGSHRYSPAGILERLIPFLDSGIIRIIGETYPAPYERLIRENKRISDLFEIIAVEPLNTEDTLNLARQWAMQQEQSLDGQPLIEESTIREAWHLVNQFLTERAAPGNLLNFLKLAQRHLFGDGQRPFGLSKDHLYLTVSLLTGLPRSILDESQGLDLSELREFFQQRVLGQSEAVDCLIERVAMIKAGLTDPTRPFGVFLFAGPTGTGKTQVAKTLAEFLFGSPERMIRLDMSEFKTSESEDRILGASDQDKGTFSLVHLIRKQPFSVVLLDEFEKAHSNVWDLFLQVFDDGRLTDRHGNSADFRHSIFILTSNLGATIHPGLSIGFSPKDSAFSQVSVEKAIATTFRREFINRLDRVVVFRPLSRAVMREILYKELKDILQRRGLRSREWAVEWEDSAIEFILEKGFTKDLGARPLKRAIERYLLSPLAETIVTHQFPEGDQFLFVRSDGMGIQVEFIDPDAPEDETAPSRRAEPDVLEVETFRLKTLVLEARGLRPEVELLKQTYDALDTQINSAGWQQTKAEALGEISSPGFWDSSGRHELLGEVEYMDRMESGLQTAGSLLRRLVGSEVRVRTSFSKDLIRRLAQQLYLLQEAYRSYSESIPKDAFLRLDATPTSQTSEAITKDFARQLSNMYLHWAKKRRMRCEILHESEGDSLDPYEFIVAVSGFGAYSILEAETGLHVLEVPADSKTFDRYHVRIWVVPQPEAPEPGVGTSWQQARNSFLHVDEPLPTVVRRYRKEPSPLVRDSVRKWRTGLLDRVLDGDFDLFV